MKVDILFLAKNRREYTEETLRQLERNTNWDLVNKIVCYDDGSERGQVVIPSFSMFALLLRSEPSLGNPVAIMNDFMTRTEYTPAPWFAKIDNDTIVPPGWLDACVAIAETDNVDLIGIEARYCENPPMVAGDTSIVKYRRTDHVGGIGLFRRSVFETHPLPVPRDTHYGFTEWQWRCSDVRKCWIDPPLPVFLLDHLDLEPWRSLGEKYIERGWQRRQWGFYDNIKDRQLFQWWLHDGL